MFKFIKYLSILCVVLLWNTSLLYADVVGSIINYVNTGKYLELETEKAYIKLTPITSDIIRVRVGVKEIAHNDKYLEDYSYAVLDEIINKNANFTVTKVVTAFI